MKKQFVYLPLFLLITTLQAGPKNKKSKFRQVEQITEQQSTGSETQLPVEFSLVETLQQIHDQTPPLTPNSQHSNDFDIAATPQNTSPIEQILASSRRFSLEAPQEVPPARACQTTMRNFCPPLSNDNDSSHTGSDSEVDIATEETEEMIKISPRFIKNLEKEALERNSFVESGIKTLEDFGFLNALEKTQDVALNLMQTRLERILFLDKSLRLRPYLESMKNESEQGEWLAKGLAQAVEKKEIDPVTRMLEIIHLYKLTNFVPTQHQEDASELLLLHAKKTISKILPQTQRISNPGDLSPRSKATSEILEAIYRTYSPELNSEVSKNLCSDFIKKLKEQE